MFLRTALTFLSLFLIIGVGSQSASLDIDDPSSVWTDASSHIALYKMNSPDDISFIKDWKDHCEREHGAETVGVIEAAPMKMVECVTGYVDLKKLQREVNVSMARGNLDRVFKKYCGYRDNILACVDHMLDKFRTCMTPQQLIDVNITRRVVDAAISFTCHDDGDRIALFMASDGVECLKSKAGSIRQCVEYYLPEVIDALQNPESLTEGSLVIDEQFCSNLNVIHDCIYIETSRCNDSTPSNILDSLIKHMLKATPCWEMNGNPPAPHGGADDDSDDDVTSGAATIGGLVKNTIANIVPILASSMSGLVGLAGVLAGCGAVFLAGAGASPQT